MLSEAVERFLGEARLGYAQATLRAYAKGLERFLEYAQEHQVSEVTESVFAGFHLWLLGSYLAPATVDQILRATRLFLKWAWENDLGCWDPSFYRLKKPVTHSPRPFTAAVMKKLLELPPRNTPQGLRDRLVLELLYNLGLRRGEVCRLNLKDLDLAKEALMVVGKGGHERLLPLNPKLREVASFYLFNGRAGLGPHTEETALLLSNAGGRLNSSQLTYVVKKYGARLSLALSPHQLRHACATHLTEAGMKLGQVQRLLGHQTPDSTRRYAQISQREMEREFQRCQLRTPPPKLGPLRYVKRRDGRE